PELARTLAELALLYVQLDEADPEALLRQHLEVTTRVFGPYHPHVALSLTNLATLHRIKGNPVAAEPLYRRALEIRRNGDERREVAYISAGLADVVWYRGDDREAETLLRESRTIYERESPSSPELADVLDRLARILFGRGDQKTHHESRALFEQALAVWE